MNLLDRFVSARFWLAPAFVAIYYTQSILPSSLRCVKHVCLAGLIAILFAAILANLRWIPDYRSRLRSGMDFLCAHKDGMPEEKEILAQIRWTNAKILAIIAMILELLVNYEKLELFSLRDQVPLMVLALLILVALFDAALDLEAEWTTSALSATRSTNSQGVNKLLLSHAIWNTNQFREEQTKLYRELHGEKQPAAHFHGAKHLQITFRSFTATAQNLISFAILVVAGTAALAIRMLWLQW